MEAKAAAEAIYRRYHRHYDGEAQGCCPLIADEIQRALGGEVVAGEITFFGGTQRRTHWWVELDGQTLDPMGDEMTSPREIVDMWAGRLPAPAPEMLRYIVARAGRPVPRDELAAALGKQPRGGHWNGGLAVLRNNGLILDGRDGLRPAALLLGEAGA